MGGAGQVKDQEVENRANQEVSHKMNEDKHEARVTLKKTDANKTNTERRVHTFPKGRVQDGAGQVLKQEEGSTAHIRK